MASAVPSHAQKEANKPDEGPWPRGVSRKPYLTIGKVVDRVRTEFPALTLSKVRYFEEQGLLSPHRSATGYRKYSEADVERLRYCLIQQRDSYLPISVILEQLNALDNGEDEAPLEPQARVVAEDGRAVEPSSQRITAREVMDLTGCDREFLEEIVHIGLITPDLSGRFAARATTIVSLLNAMTAEGVNPKQLTFIRTAAERQADLADHSAGGIANARGANKERVRQKASETAELIGRLNQELIRLYFDNHS